MTRNFTKQTGWLKTRAIGILALLLNGNPDMNWEDIYAWCHANNLDHWSPSVSPSDYSAFVGGSGYIYFEDSYQLPRGWASLFSQWKNGAQISELPEVPKPGSPAAAVMAVAVAASEPIQTSTTVQTDSQSVQATAVESEASAVPVAIQTVYPQQLAPSAIAEAEPHSSQAPATIANTAETSAQQVADAQNGIIPLMILAALF
jgi:hypothetical protein